MVYQAYGYRTARQERPVLSGGQRVSGWRPDERMKGFWRADAGALRTRQLYVDERRATPLTFDGADLPDDLALTETGYATRSAVPARWRNPADIEFVYRFGYVEGRCGVAGIARAEGRTTITMDQPCWDFARALYGADSLAFVHAVENSPSFPADPGDWYLDRSRPGHHELPPS